MKPYNLEIEKWIGVMENKEQLDIINKVLEPMSKGMSYRVNSMKKMFNSEKPQYEVINEAKCWTQGLKLNAFPKIERNPQRMLLSDGLDREVDDDKRGGIILFATKASAIEQFVNKVAEEIKAYSTTSKCGWSIGHYVDGRIDKYVPQFNADSLCLEIVGITLEALISFAEDICRDFQQTEVLVKEYRTNRVFLVNP